MQEIRPDEIRLVGRREMRDGRVVEDETTERINALVTSALVKLASAADGWRVLYVDPRDGRLWELDYPESDSHGGGPPSLEFLRPSEAADRYGF